MRNPARQAPRGYDVILYGHTSLGLKDQILGIDTRGARWRTQDAGFPSHGVPDASEDITGSIGWAGMSNPGL
jgi:hypothetical protein